MVLAAGNTKRYFFALLLGVLAGSADPKGQGLNQAQIDAMERQRQLMWNATGGGMVYR